MRGSIRQRGNHSWEIQLYTGNGPDGKVRRHFETIHGRKGDAQRRLTELLSSLDKGTFMKPGKTTLAEFLERWLKDYAKPNLSPRGFERYQGIITKHLIPDFGNITLTQLKPEHLQKHYTTKLSNGLSAGTIRYHHAVIHKALQTAVKWGLVNRNVADGVDIPRIHHNEMQTWNEYEITRFLETAKDSPYYALFYTALYTGMRRSELLALCWPDVDFIFCQVSVSRSLHHLKDGSYVFTQPKSAKSRRTIALPPSVILMLKEHK